MAATIRLQREPFDAADSAFEPLRQESFRHVHVQELDGKHCGWGDYDYKPVLEMLRRRNYQGWVSLEAFDFTPGAEKLVTESLRHLEAEIAKLPA